MWFANSTETYFYQKKLHKRSLLKKKKAGSKLIRQQRVRFPFLGTSIKEESHFIKIFNIKKY